MFIKNNANSIDFFVLSLQRKQKLPTRQICQKYSKSASRLIVCKFIDRFRINLSVIIDRLKNLLIKLFIIIFYRRRKFHQ